MVGHRQLQPVTCFQCHETARVFQTLCFLPIASESLSTQPVSYPPPPRDGTEATLFRDNECWALGRLGTCPSSSVLPFPPHPRSSLRPLNGILGVHGGPHLPRNVLAQQSASLRGNVPTREGGFSHHLLAFGFQHQAPVSRTQGKDSPLPPVCLTRGPRPHAFSSSWGSRQGQPQV